MRIAEARAHVRGAHLHRPSHPRARDRPPGGAGGGRDRHGPGRRRPPASPARSGHRERIGQPEEAYARREIERNERMPRPRSGLPAAFVDRVTIRRRRWMTSRDMDRPANETVRTLEIARKRASSTRPDEGRRPRRWRSPASPPPKILRASGSPPSRTKRETARQSSRDGGRGGRRPRRRDATERQRNRDVTQALEMSASRASRSARQPTSTAAAVEEPREPRLSSSTPPQRRPTRPEPSEGAPRESRRIRDVEKAAVERERVLDAARLERRRANPEQARDSPVVQALREAEMPSTEEIERARIRLREGPRRGALYGHETERAPARRSARRAGGSSSPTVERATPSYAKTLDGGPLPEP